MAPKLVKQYQTVKVQEKAHLQKEQEDAAKAELYLSGSMQSWK